VINILEKEFEKEFEKISGKFITKKLNNIYLILKKNYIFIEIK